MSEQEAYDIAMKGKGKKAAYKLANYMAHGYEIEATKKVTVLVNKDRVLVLDNDGNTIKGCKAI